MPATLRPHRRLAAYRGVACPRCGRPLDDVPTGSATCPRCRRAFEAVRFAPPAPRLEVVALADAGPGGATPCGAHRANVAVGSCGRCGVFLCALCRIVTDGMVLCPPCFDRLLAEDALESARATRPDYGARASTTAAAGFLFCLPLGMVLGPLSVYYAVKGLRDRGESLGPRWGTVAALLLGLAEALISIVWLASLLGAR